EPAQADFLGRVVRGDLQIALSLGLSSRAGDSVAALSASWLLNGKGLAQEALTQPTLLARDSKDANLARVAARVLAARRQLARLTYIPPPAGQETVRLKELEELSKQEQELGKELRRAGSKAAVITWAELAEVRKAMPADSALVDIAHFVVHDFKARRGTQRQ